MIIRKIFDGNCPEIREKVECLVEVVCLLHDIGNPPFGHCGEQIIRSWISRFIEKNSNNLSDKNLNNDLINFDGNPQGVRIVHSILKLGLNHNIIHAMIKYSNCHYNSEPYPISDVKNNKSGYYFSENDIIEKIIANSKTGKLDKHPICSIMDVSDDIANSLADIEDAIENGIKDDAFFIDSIQDLIKKSKDLSKKIRLENLKTFSESKIHILNYFIDQYTQQLEEKEISQCSITNDQIFTFLGDLRKKNIYNNKDLESAELFGIEAINGLLDHYSCLLILPYNEFNSILKKEPGTRFKYPKESRLLNKLSPKQLDLYTEIREKHLDKDKKIITTHEYYFRFRMIIDYISGMTDRFAADEYQKLSSFKE